MYFGLTNSPATSQMMMNEIFQDLITEGVVSVYLDDILIFTNLLEEHRWITCLVLDRMREHKCHESDVPPFSNLIHNRHNSCAHGHQTENPLYS
jgi:hypothetical protein